uniref:Uncharacterized protein n=1 Tax=Plectus sambesii TaxID=2011161 RepID=A0A914W9T1_9BILA
MTWEWSRDWPYGVLIGIGVMFGVWLLQALLNLCAPPLLKKCFNYRRALRQLKSALEKSYPDDCWDDSDFCKAYLKAYEKFRDLRNVAKRGEINVMSKYDEQWVEFDTVDVKLLR